MADDAAEDAEDQVGRQSNATVRPRCSPRVNALLQTLLQQGDTDAVKPYLTIVKEGRQWNAGDVIAALAWKAGFDWSKDGKRVWRRSEPEAAAMLEPTAARNTLRPAEQRTTALGGLDEVNLQHDAEAEGVGAPAAQRAAEAAQPEPPRALGLVKAATADKLKRGSGWGNVPRPLTHCCVAEQSQLDSLIVIVQEHALQFPEHGPLQRVDGGDGVYWSSHSMGVVNAIRLQV